MPRSPPGLLQLALTDPCTITVNNHYNTDIDKHKVGKNFKSLYDRSYSAGLYLFGGFLILVDLLT